MNDLLIKQVGTIVFLVIILWLGSGRLSGWSQGQTQPNTKIKLRISKIVPIHL